MSNMCQSLYSGLFLLFPWGGSSLPSSPIMPTTNLPASTMTSTWRSILFASMSSLSLFCRLLLLPPPLPPSSSPSPPVIPPLPWPLVFPLGLCHGQQQPRFSLEQRHAQGYVGGSNSSSLNNGSDGCSVWEELKERGRKNLRIF